MNTALIVLTATTLVAAPATASDDAAQLKNWYDDPFFSVSSDIPGCPVPLGPLLTRSEMQREAHARVERGTRCYLEGKCTRTNSYLNDADIGAKLREALAHRRR